jgi:predicted Rossmann-fold nucleotide-binding protein
MGNARNCINVLSSNVVVACPGGAGTISEIALALKSGRPVILMNFDVQNMFKRCLKAEMLFAVKSPEKVIAKIKYLFP